MEVFKPVIIVFQELVATCVYTIAVFFSSQIHVANAVS